MPHAQPDSELLDEIRTVFDIYDDNKSGSLDAEEFAHALTQIGGCGVTQVTGLDRLEGVDTGCGEGAGFAHVRELAGLVGCTLRMRKEQEAGWMRRQVRAAQAHLHVTTNQGGASCRL